MSKVQACINNKNYNWTYCSSSDSGVYKGVVGVKRGQKIACLKKILHPILYFLHFDLCKL